MAFTLGMDGLVGYEILVNIGEKTQGYVHFRWLAGEIAWSGPRAHVEEI